ncbi:MAG: phospho-sugar mutase [Bacillota bacterium]|nr:phospho-sugar mutase [Bacillota bacterium]
MISCKQQYYRWLTEATDDMELIADLEKIEQNSDEIHERFYRDLEFGTAGLRGILGAGTNRMNIYTVRLATQGLANFLNKRYKNPSVAISHDSRHKSRLFTEESARVLAANGIKVFISRELEPTPVLSFCVRELKCNAGIMITASHNPAIYNGYKCYGEDGCQMTDHAAGEVYNEISKLDCFKDVKLCSFDEALNSGTIDYIKEETYEAYLQNVLSQTVNKDICKDAGLSVVYTPLNGTGNILVREALKRINVNDIKIVKEQELPDGNFPTCPYPNPEIPSTMNLGLELARQTGADLLLATDPDADRVGIAAKDKNGEYRLFSGNETGILLTNYILMSRKELGNLPQNPIIVKTIVTSILIDRICKKYGCERRNVLTGFKYIGDQILRLEQVNEENRFVFGFEESSGYLAGTYVRDKDAVVASMLICEMAAFYKKQNKNLPEIIDELYAEYGYYLNTTLNFEFDGASGLEKMTSIMTELRENPPKAIANIKVVALADYLKSQELNVLTGETEKIDLPSSNVIAFSLEDGGSAIVRPSGTEPKIKLYITSVGKEKSDAEEKANLIASNMEKFIGV